jgi:hypothetical protein
MSRIDQFESVFLAATRTLYTYQRVEIKKAMILSDLTGDEAASFAQRVRSFLSVLGEEVEWTSLDGETPPQIGELLDRLKAEGTELVVTYRNLHSGAWRWPHSLGEYVDILTQAAEAAVLVVPRPDLGSWSGEGGNTDAVLALTDHLTGDARLVDTAARFTAPGGELCLAHVEDERIFERYVEVVAKIPDIDTDIARREILEQLLKEPADYITSCKEVLRSAVPDLRLAKVVTTGHHTTDIGRLVKERRSDLLVLNTKDDDQLAMHGLAYPLAVELVALPMLLL